MSRKVLTVHLPASVGEVVAALMTVNRSEAYNFARNVAAAFDEDRYSVTLCDDGLVVWDCKEPAE